MYTASGNGRLKTWASLELLVLQIVCMCVAVVCCKLQGSVHQRVDGLHVAKIVWKDAQSMVGHVDHQGRSLTLPGSLWALQH